MWIVQVRGYDIYIYRWLTGKQYRNNCQSPHEGLKEALELEGMTRVSRTHGALSVTIYND